MNPGFYLSKDCQFCSTLQNYVGNIFFRDLNILDFWENKSEGTRYNIPFLLNKPGVGYNVYGEVYEVDDTMFANLDVLEDYPNYYDREIQQIKTEKNEYIDCWLYLIKQYPDQLLFKRYLEKYNNSETLPYCERSERLPEVKAKDDMTY
nr:putative gamma-glutamylcyclotransferase CG2811 isoform X3 [Bactrocera oleae]